MQQASAGSHGPTIRIYKPSCQSPETREDAQFCEERKAADAEQRSADAADFALFVGFGTFVLLGFTLYYTKRAAEAAERAVTELERPFVSVRFRRPGLVTESDGRMHYDGHFALEFVNHGRSPAFLMELLDTYPTEARGALLYPLGEPLKGSGLPEGTVSAPRAPFQITKNTMEVYGKVLEEGSWKAHRFFAVGFVRYRDIFGNVYALGYCGLYDPIGNRFVLFGGDKLNFTRQEVWALGRKPRRAWFSRLTKK